MTAPAGAMTARSSTWDASTIQVKIRGYRIELGEIETAIARHPAVREVVVVVREDVPGDKRLVAYLVTENPPTDLVDQLRAQLRAGLPEYMVPSAFVTLETLPRTTNGKLDRKALPAPDVSRQSDRGSYSAPRAPAEKAIAQIWNAVLGVDRVGIDDNFFDLGGHSLLLLQAHNRLRASLRPDLPVVALLQYPTIRTLARYLDAAPASAFSSQRRRWSAHRSSVRPCSGNEASRGNASDVLLRSVRSGRGHCDRRHGRPLSRRAQRRGAVAQPAGGPRDDLALPRRRAGAGTGRGHGGARESRPTCGRAAFLTTSRCSTPDSSASTPKRSGNPRSAAARVPGDRVGGARRRRLRPAEIHRPDRRVRRRQATTATTCRTCTSRRDVTDIVGSLTMMTSNEKDYLTTRVAYKLDLKGPALNIQTACSTSLVAVCSAVQSLLSYQCDMALAGGVSITLPQRRGYLWQEGAITSPDGHCRAFDRDAQGTVFSNGVGIVVLRRLRDAKADGDTIYAVIKGAALNNDGSTKVSFTAPSVDGHAQVISMAHALGGIDPGNDLVHRSARNRHAARRPDRDRRADAGIPRRWRARNGVLRDRLAQNQHRPPGRSGRRRRPDQDAHLRCTTRSCPPACISSRRIRSSVLTTVRSTSTRGCNRGSRAPRRAAPA